MHNVHRFLPEFIESIERQTFGLEGLEVIAVDDGSTDDSLRVLKEWATRSPNLVKVVTKDNGGQGSARNLGMEYATGEWITMPDPDDLLAPDYFEIVDGFLRANPAAIMAATARILWYEDTGIRSNNHPLRHMFECDQLINLDRAPLFFHGSAPAAFFRSDIIAREKLRFDVQIRPNFEDGHFCARYLMAAGAPLVGFLGSAQYIYRKRADGTSTLQNGLLQPGRFNVVPRRGYLDLLQRRVAASGYAPEWVQNLVLYELSFYFGSDLRMSGATAAHGRVADEFTEILREIAELLQPEVVDSFDIGEFLPVWRDILLHGLSGRPWVAPVAALDSYDEAHETIRLSYRFAGDAPTEQIFVSGEPLAIAEGKIWTHEYFDHELMHERVAWIPSHGTIRVQLNGKPVRLQPTWQRCPPTAVGPARLRDWMRADATHARSRKLRAPTKAVRALAHTPPVRRTFGDCWALMDRIHDADDNGERLFRYLRDNRPEINAWFILEKDTPDWARLKRDGYGRRLIAHGGVLWRLVMLNCGQLVSSHADTAVYRPPAILRMNPRPQWKFTFLQHGVIKDDLSRWLNPRHIDLFVTSTPQEHQSIVGDYTHYQYTTREVKMTGLPRFDRLRELGDEVPVDARRWILVCPTWRYWLTPPSKSGSQRHDVDDDFFDSDFARQWNAFLGDERLRTLAQENGLQIGFLPHPNTQPALSRMNLPTHVRALTYDSSDIQQLIADSALMVTDYSSMAFNAAYIDRPVVYFQFDTERMAEGEHIGRPGYFNYQRDGFGPVTDSVPDAVAAVASVLDTGDRRPLPQYQERIGRTFPQRDGRCCERTTAAIEAMNDLRPRRSLPKRVARRLARRAYADRAPTA